MNGIHDLGGMHGLGPVGPRPTSRCSTSRWERRVFGAVHRELRLAAGSTSTSSGTRSRRWRRRTTWQPRYYEHWLTAVETLLVENGVP